MNPRTVSPFGDYSVRIDPWAVDYGGETPTEFQPDAEDAPEARLNVERDAADWAPITPPVLPRASRSRSSTACGAWRPDLSSRATAAPSTAPSVLTASAWCSVAKGARPSPRNSLGRVAIFGAGEMPPAALALAPSLNYLPRSVAEDDADAPLRGLHGEMRTAEGELARAHAAAGRIVLADGPLNVGESTRGHVVGFVKRLFKLYLPPEQLPVLAAAAARHAHAGVPHHLGGTVLALFVVPAHRPATRRSNPTSRDWYASKCQQSVGRDEAIRLADLTSALLPRFVPSRTRDPRAPQNLVPIGALEQHLRRGLGDARLIHRRLATRLAREFVHV